MFTVINLRIYRKPCFFGLRSERVLSYPQIETVSDLWFFFLFIFPVGTDNGTGLYPHPWNIRRQALWTDYRIPISFIPSFNLTFAFSSSSKMSRIHTLEGVAALGGDDALLVPRIDPITKEDILVGDAIYVEKDEDGIEQHLWLAWPLYRHLCRRATRGMSLISPVDPSVSFTEVPADPESHTEIEGEIERLIRCGGGSREFKLVLEEGTYDEKRMVYLCTNHSFPEGLECLREMGAGVYFFEAMLSEYGGSASDRTFRFLLMSSYLDGWLVDIDRKARVLESIASQSVLDEHSRRFGFATRLFSEVLNKKRSSRLWGKVVWNCVDKPMFLKHLAGYGILPQPHYTKEKKRFTLVGTAINSQNNALLSLLVSFPEFDSVVLERNIVGGKRGKPAFIIAFENGNLEAMHILEKAGVTLPLESLIFWLFTAKKVSQLLDETYEENEEGVPLKRMRHS